MQIKQTRYQTTTLALLLLLLLTGCRDGTNLPTEPEAEGTYRIESFTLVGAQTTLFKTSGVINDQGTVEGEPLPVHEEAGTRVVRYRMFNSENGYIAVRVEAHFVTNGARIVEGAFDVLESTGSYATVQEQGAYHALLDERGDPVEYFSGRAY